MDNKETKIAHMQELCAYREQLLHAPILQNLFLELTLRCNEHCLHCGSACGDVQSSELSLEDYKRFLTKIKSDFKTKEPMIFVTGGEPLLRKDFFDIVGFANDLGFRWGMTSNGVLIDRACAHKLREAGMRTVSISIDGLPHTHDHFRQTPGGYDRAVQGVQNLIDEGGFSSIMVTTVVTHESIGELDALYKVFNDIDIDSWRIAGIEPMGRAKQHPELLLTTEDQKYLLDFIRQKRLQGEPVTYGCSHYLGTDYEREVRDWYFLCNAGIYTASITASGDMVACLDIERRPELIQGNILNDDFTDRWYNGYKAFRRNLCDENEKCRHCDAKVFCHGGPFHSWNFEEKRPEICMKGVLFDA